MFHNVKPSWLNRGKDRIKKKKKIASTGRINPAKSCFNRDSYEQ